jgi:hypothetical protein
MGNYLDQTGLEKTLGFLKDNWMSDEGLLGYTSSDNNYAVQKDADTEKLYVNVKSAKSFYGECSNIPTAATKVVTIDNFTENDLVNGTRISVKFTNANTALSPKLNVSNTGAKYIYSNSSNILPGLIDTGMVYDFVYNNNGWYIVGVSNWGNINMTSNTISTTISLSSMPPNRYYKYSEPVSSVNIRSYGMMNNAILNEYMLEFVAAAGCTLSLPSDTKWIGGVAPTLVAGKTYQISIVNNLAVWAEF